jgi:hypothetical protein
VEEQVQAQAEHSSMPLPLSGPDSLASLLSQLYFAPLQFEEIPNYAEQLSPQIDSYLENPLNGLLRGWVAGALLLAFTLAGMLAGLARVPGAGPRLRRDVGLLMVATLAQTLALLPTLPFPYQRYYLPLLPFTALWQAYSLRWLARLTNRLPVRRAA